MARKIKVLHLIDSLALGGAQTMLFACLPRFEAARYDFTLAALHGGRRAVFWERARGLGFKVVALSPSRFVPLYALTLPGLLALRRYDVVHCHLYAANWLGKPLARLLGTPAVVGHDHCFDAFRFKAPWRQIDGWTAGCGHLTFVISSSLADRLVREEGLNPKRLVILQNGFASRPPKVPKNGDSDGLRWIGAAGRLVGWKRFERFLQLAQAMRAIDPRYAFIIAGDGPARRELKAMAVDLGLEHHVVFPGAVARLEPFFDRLSAFVLTSDLEDVPMVLLEAFAHRVPTATLAISPVRSQLLRETLLLDPTRKASVWAEEVDGLLRDAAKCSALTSAAAKALDERFSIDAQVAAMDAHYRRLLAGRR
ncbi:MAG TPA: glycosyltransferase family 4 protein [Chthoniobacterales bacterium]